eukprot:1608972-Rhodomonas_salina.6
MQALRPLRKSVTSMRGAASYSPGCDDVSLNTAQHKSADQGRQRAAAPSQIEVSESMLHDSKRGRRRERERERADPPRSPPSPPSQTPRTPVPPRLPPCGVPPCSPQGATPPPAPSSPRPQPPRAPTGLRLLPPQCAATGSCALLPQSSCLRAGSAAGAGGAEAPSCALAPCRLCLPRPPSVQMQEGADACERRLGFGSPFSQQQPENTSLSKALKPESKQVSYGFPGNCQQYLQVLQDPLHQCRQPQVVLERHPWRCTSERTYHAMSGHRGLPAREPRRLR